MASTDRVAKRATVPHPVRVVLHYANATPTERGWRRAAVGPFRRFIEVPKEAPVFGLSTRAELVEHLGEFRGILARWLKLRRTDRVEEAALLGMLKERGRLRIERWLRKSDGRLTASYATDSNSLSEMLYSYLALALSEVPASRLRQCVACPRFFLCASRKRALYCSGRCRIRTMMRRYRKRLRAQRG
jgi:hypothetical protein